MQTLENIGRAIADTLRELGVTSEAAIAYIAASCIDTYGELGLSALVDAEADDFARYSALRRVERATIASIVSGTDPRSLRFDGREWVHPSGLYRFSPLGLGERYLESFLRG